MGEKYSFKNNGKAKLVLRVVGFVCTGLGFVFIVIGLIDFFGAMGGFGMPTDFWAFFVGAPLLFVGVSCLMFGYLHAFANYSAGETAPVAKDVTNYMLDGTREEFTKTVAGVTEAVKGEKPIGEGPICPNCGTKNEPGALFCDNCGKPLGKKCPACGEVNDADATYCRKCGKRL